MIPLCNGGGADSDADGDALSVIPADIVTATGGSVLLLSNGSFIYTPAANYHGVDSFGYTVLDGRGGQDIGLVSITVAPLNDAPVAANDAFAGSEDAAIAGNLLADNGAGVDSDLDGDTLAVTGGSFATAQGGSVFISPNGSFMYNPAGDFYGIDSFDYTLSDGAGGSAVATATLTVAGVNDAPVAADDAFTGTENTEIEGNLLADNGFGADRDIEGDNLQVLADMVTSAQGGSVIILGNGDFVYMPPVNFFGQDSFDYTLTDGKGGFDTATANINLAQTNAAPDARDDAFRNYEDQTIAGNVLDDNGAGRDSDPDGDALTIAQSIFTTANGGHVSLNADGSFVYTPAAGFFGQDSFDYTLTDGNGGQAIGTVTLDVTAATLRGNECNNVLIGKGDADIILGKGGNDTLIGQRGDDVIFGGAGRDKLLGGKGADTLDGGTGNDCLSGGEGRDTLLGGAGNDTLFGNNGNDILDGGAGRDSLRGGNGADIFKFSQDSLAGGLDRVEDFSARKGDKIDISEVLTESYDPVQDMLSQFVSIERSGRGDAVLKVDADGTGTDYQMTAIAIIEGGKSLNAQEMVDQGALVI